MADDGLRARQHDGLMLATQAGRRPGHRAAAGALPDGRHRRRPPERGPGGRRIPGAGVSRPVRPGLVRSTGRPWLDAGCCAGSPGCTARWYGWPPACGAPPTTPPTCARPLWLLRRTLLRPADRAAAGAARAYRPAAIVSFHPLTGMAAVWARDQAAPLAPVVTVVTDLTAMHAAWRYADADLIIAPPAVVGPALPGRRSHPASSRPGESAGSAWAVAGPPVQARF